MKEFTYEIKKHIGTISSSADGKIATEVNLISFNGADPKIDIRTWRKDTGRMYKGITLSDQETENLLQILLGMKEGD